MKPIAIPPLTEEQKQTVRNYFNGDTAWQKESRIYFRYWRMRAEWERILAAEMNLKKVQDEQKEKYKRHMERVINENIKEDKKRWWDWNYVIVKVNQWTKWNTVVLGFDDGWDIETKKQKLSKVIEIEERKNPDYYKEIINRYNFIDN